MNARFLLGAVALLAACGPPKPRDAKVAVKLVRGDADPLRDPGSASRGASPVGSIRIDFTFEGLTQTSTVALTAGTALDLRFVPRGIAGKARLQLLGLRAEDGLVYSAARTPVFTLDGGATQQALFFGPVDALTPVGPALAGPRTGAALAALGAAGALIVGGESGADGGFVPATPGLVFFRTGEARACGFDEGCLSGDQPPPRTDAIAVTLPNGKVLHGLGRLAGGALDTNLFLTGEDGTTQRVATTGDLLPGLAGAQAAALADGTVLIAGGETATGPTRTVFLVDPRTGLCTRQTLSLVEARRSGGVAVMSSGQVLIAGGVGATGPLDSVELCTPGQSCAKLDGGQFAQVRRNMLGARVRPALVRLPDDSVAIVGGGIADHEIFRLDLGTSIGGLVSMTEPPAFLSHVSPGVARLGTGQLLVVGGEAAGRTPLAAIFAPDPNQVLSSSQPTYAGTWRPVAAGPNLRARAQAVELADGSALVVGGGLEGEPYSAGAQSAPRVEVLVPAPLD